MAKQLPWWQEGVIYQIYPRSFLDTSGNGIGDLNGIIQKLDYLEDLGVDAIWLSPVNPSPDVDFGYDVSDYLNIDPKFGTLDDFKKLVRVGEERNIRIVMDIVLNHSSDQHAWFKKSRSPDENPYKDWYIWQDPDPRGGAPNNWLSIFGGKAWEWDEGRGQYYYHMFYKEQPDLNWRNPKVRDALLDVFRFWLDLGVKGFRLDVFNMYFKDEKLRSNPTNPIGLRPFDRQTHQYDVDQPEMAGVLQKIRNVLDGYEDVYAIGEALFSSPEKSAGYCGTDALHQTFNFKFMDCSYNPNQFKAAVQEWETALGEQKWPNYVLNNHDVKRSATRYGIGEDDERQKVLAALLLSLRGTPFLYYGEEIGMRESDIKRSEIHDPIGRHYWPLYKGRDGCRTPMQWESGENGGFSNSMPWLPLHKDYKIRNVENQNEKPNSLLNFYRHMLAIRRETPALVSGDITLLEGIPNGILAYRRQTPISEAVVLLNFRKADIRCDISEEKRFFQKVLSSKDGLFQNQAVSTVHLKPDEALVMTAFHADSKE